MTLGAVADDAGSVTKVEFPEALAGLFEPHRYKVLYGGRGAAKSWGIARYLLVRGAKETIRVLCAREFQSSIGDSVHALLKDQIAAMGLQNFYEVQKTTILGRNGTTFLFEGLRHNIASVKSTEAVDVCWVEEAQTVRKGSWDTLIPTIRKDSSEIIVSFHPELETAETYKRFVTNPPPGAMVRKIGWQDNPWFPQVLRDEMDHLRNTDMDAYLTVWEGHCRQTLDGAIYANEIRKATEETRICSVPYENGKPVHTFWDLGRRDKTAIWFVQIIGFEFHIIDYYEASGHALDHFLKVIQDRGYIYGEHWLPHDAKHQLLASKLTIKQQMQAVGHKVMDVPNMSVADGIAASRAVFGKCWFDEKKTSDGLQCLRHYQYDYDPDTKERSMMPLHNWASHGSDSFRYLAASLREAKPKSGVKPYVAPSFNSNATSWMR